MFQSVRRTPRPSRYRNARRGDGAARTLLLSLVFVSPLAAWCPLAAGADIDLYIMAGQSNSWGNADATLLPQFMQQPRPGVLYNGILQVKSDPGPELTDWRPLGPRQGGHNLHYGPEVPFGWMLPDDSAVFHFAVKGSNLRNGWRNTYLNEMFVALDLAITDLEALGHTVHVAGMTWNQGEGDSGKLSHALAYSGHLAWMIDTVRDWVGDPDLPFTIARLHADVDRDFAAELRDSQQWVTENVHDTWLVNVDDVPLGPDSVHYVGDAAWPVLGPRYAGPFVAPTDFSSDGAINLDDYDVLSSRYHEYGTWDQGDVDGSGYIDFEDFVNLALSMNAAPPATPEPATLMLALIMSGAVAMRRA